MSWDLSPSSATKMTAKDRTSADHICVSSFRMEETGLPPDAGRTMRPAAEGLAHRRKIRSAGPGGAVVGRRQYVDPAIGGYSPSPTTTLARRTDFCKG